MLHASVGIEQSDLRQQHTVSDKSSARTRRNIENTHAQIFITERENSSQNASVSVVRKDGERKNEILDTFV